MFDYLSFTCSDFDSDKCSVCFGVIRTWASLVDIAYALVSIKYVRLLYVEEYEWHIYGAVKIWCWLHKILQARVCRFARALMLEITFNGSLLWFVIIILFVQHVVIVGEDDSLCHRIRDEIFDPDDVCEI